MATLAFGAYALALLAALLWTGSLSDVLGRRPVIAGALVIQLASMLTLRWRRTSAGSARSCSPCVIHGREQRAG
jgi:MFS family permease